jgi:hypothetical protein
VRHSIENLTPSRRHFIAASMKNGAAGSNELIFARDFEGHHFRAIEWHRRQSDHPALNQGTF